MYLPRPVAFRRSAAATILLCLVPFPGAAHAQPVPQPVLDSAPWRVALRGAATIRGHLENGTPGQHVRLQRRRAGGRWRVIADKPTDGDNAVEFRRRGLRTTAEYRLVYKDDVSGARAVSNVKIVRVKSKVEFRLSPDDVLRGRTTVLSGRLRPSERGRTVSVGHRVDGRWKRIDRLRVRDGSFETSISLRKVGRRGIRVRFAGDALNLGDKARQKLRVYKPAIATWYGPGFYGRRTACGRRLRYDTMGVAHRRIECGTKVRFLYHGRTISVPVIDRGPYGGKADWDLTRAAADRLGFCCQDRIGVLRRPS
jgi:rare lipoprotein A